MSNEAFELSASQIRILLAELKQVGTRAYHLYIRIDFDQADEEWLKKSIPFVFSGNFGLRIHQGASDFSQYYSDETAGYTEIDVSHMTEEEVQAILSEKKKEGIAPVFDAPLFRIYLIHTKDKTVFFGIFHHLITDGTTIQTIIPSLLDKCIADLKSGNTPSVRKKTYHEYIRRVKEYLQTNEAEADRKYWIDKLTGYKGISYRAAESKKETLYVDIPEEISAALKAYQDKDGISSFVLGLGSAFMYFSGIRSMHGSVNTEMVWEISVHGRYFGEELAADTGMFVGTIPLRLAYDPALSYAQNMQYVKSVMKEGLIHARTDTNEYISELAKTGTDPLMLTSFSAVSNSAAENRGEATYPDETDVPFHIRVNLNKNDKEGLKRLVFEYNSSIFKKADIREIAEGILSLLKSASENTDLCPKDLKLKDSALIRKECLIERNLYTADEPIALQSGLSKRTSGKPSSAKSSAGKVKDPGMKDASRCTAALLNALVRFGMSKDILIGLKSGTSVIPFGIKADTSQPASSFLKETQDKIKEFGKVREYPFYAREDIDFEPSVVLSFDEKVDADDRILIGVSISGEGIRISYNRERYSDEYMSAFLNSIRTFYDSMDKQTPLKDIDLVPAGQKEHVISLKNEGTVNAVFDRLVSAQPDKKILIASDKTMTLADLDREASRVGNALRIRGVQEQDRVLILMRRTSALVTSVFSVLKCGAVFITMDPDYPKERIEQILEDSDAALIITDIPRVKDDLSKAVMFDDLIKTENADNGKLGLNITPDSMCFIIYTSGTTGKPKGVVLSHRGITNYIAPEKENEPIWYLKEKCSCMLCLSSVSFIVFLREIFGTILNGIPVVLCNEEQAVNPMAIASLIKENHIDAMGSTPTRLLQYSQVPAFTEALAGIRFMIVGGEGFPARLYSIIRKYSSCEIYNSYGPTEVTIASHQKKMESAAVSAGFPMLNVWDRVSDIDGGELPPYAVGELYVGGAGVAIGYFRDDKLTGERFPVIDGERYVNTGDLAYKDEKGEVFVLGRNDGMIKLRGLRIELEEIENVLSSYPGISHIRVVVQNVNGTEHLCAFYTLTDGDESIPADTLRKYIGDKLPPYMVPTYYTRLNEFPMTPNGKVAIKVLKTMPVDTEGRVDMEAPRPDVEKEIFDIISGIINMDKFGVNEDLFSLGLTSLSIINVVNALYEKYGISVNVTDLMKRRTIADIAALVDELKKEASSESKVSDTEDAIREFYPITANQMGIYLDCELHPDSIGYHLPNFMRFGREIDPQRLKNAIIRMVSHHPYLTVTLEMADGSVMQKRNSNADISEAVTVEHVDRVDEEMLKKLAAEPFTLLGKLLFRFKIFDTDDGLVLFSLFHHLIVDGGSLNIIYHDIASAYEGSELSREDLDGYGLSLREKSSEDSVDFQQAREYFHKQMAITDEATILTANLKNDVDTAGLAVESIGIEPQVVDDFCEKYHISPNILFMTALTVVLTKFNSDDKLLIATISNGRIDHETRGTVALLVKTLPLILKPDRTIPITELFEYISGVWMETMGNQIYPFTNLSREYDLHPEFFYTYHGRIYEDISINGRTYSRERIAYDSLRYKTMVNVILEDKYYIRTEYNDAIYSSDYIHTFVECMAKVIDDWTKSPSLDRLSIKDISLGKENYKYDFKPLEKIMVHQVIEEMAAKMPDKEILYCSGETLTYDQLNQRANRIANALRKRGVREGGRIVLLMPRTANLIATMVGVLKAGAAYIPMDVEYPEERVSYVVEDAGADFVITDRDFGKKVSVEELLEETDTSNPPITVDPDRISYMIYTSGSTGRPKGVELTHKGLSNLLLPVPENNYYHTRKDKPASVLGTATVSFDISVIDIMGCLQNGMKFIFANDDENRDVGMLINLIKKTKPEALGMMTPSRLHQYLQVPEFAEAIAGMRMCSVGGEPFLPALYRKIRDFSDMDIYNVYGPSETTIITNSRIVREDYMTSVGNALYNVRCDIRDIDMKMLPIGVVGEMYIGGYCVGRGYHNLPEKTEAAFIRINDQPYFKSGDFCYELPDGNFMVCGRRDGQIKLRGLRIETGEIEGSMEAYPGVKNAAVVIKKIKKVDHLCGYYVADTKIDNEELREFLASRLTSYMVPTILMQLDSMPFTPNGKTDKKRLPDPEIKKDYEAPCTQEEEFFCTVFENVLDIERVGATDDFFTIGGSSLLATQLTILASNGGYAIKFRDIFENPTPRKLALFVTGNAGESKTGKEEKDIAEYDYTAIHERLLKNTFENYLNGKRHVMHNVLLTGATGFLGIHVLKELLSSENIKVYCMLRGGGKHTAEERLTNRMFYYFEDDLSEAYGSRLFIREGAITGENDFAAFDDVDIDTIINCAASVKHFSAGDDIYKANYIGVQNGLEYAVKHGCRYIQISTTSTGGEILLDGEHERFVYDENVLYKGQILDNQYLSSKFLAERAVLEAAVKGADVKVIRVGNLMARNEDGIFQMNFNTNGFVSRLKAYVTLKEMPYRKMTQKMEMSPIDVTAQAIVALAQSPSECCLFNCYNNHNASYGEIVHVANEIGIELKPVTDDEFDKSLEEAMHDEKKRDGISGLVTTVGMGTRKEREITPSANDYTTMALYHEGIYWPAVSELYIRSFIDFLDGLGFWED